MKTALRHILLAALLLRAMIPLGWMPGQAQLGEAAFIICNADGGITHGGKQDQAQSHQLCAFAAAAQMASAPQAIFLAPPSAQIPAPAKLLPPILVATAAFSPQSPRAPPLFV